MKSTANTSSEPDNMVADLQASNALLRQEVQQLKQQLDWFKKQIFGQKSEKRFVDNSTHPSLFDELPVPDDSKTEKQTITYKRRKNKQRDKECVTEKGLRFDKQVPVEIITIEAPQMQGPDAQDYEVIDEKVTRRLAQRPGSYVVLEYRRQMVKHKTNQTLNTAAAPETVFEKSMVHFSFLFLTCLNGGFIHCQYLTEQDLFKLGIANGFQ